MITSSSTAAATDRTEEYVRLQSRYQPRVFSFILTLVPHWADAEEILQETNVVLWRKFDTFNPGSNYLGWAKRVAYLEVLKYRRRNKKKLLLFSDEVLEKIADDEAEMAEGLQIQRQSLMQCIRKLPDKDRNLIQVRYAEDATVKHVADQLGRSTDAIYKSLRRVRHALLNCVQRLTSAEDRAV